MSTPRAAMFAASGPLLVALSTGPAFAQGSAEPPVTQTPSPADRGLPRPVIRPVLADLGVADVAWELPDGVEDPALIVAVTAAGASAKDIRVPLAPGAGRTRTARIMTGDPDGEFRLECTRAGRTQRVGPFRIPGGSGPVGPSWAAGAVWYQIFPERFRNGNPLNDPRGPGVFLKAWTDDWYAIDPAEERAWRSRTGRSDEGPLPDRPGGPLYHWIYDRRYGGDLQGIVQKLDELKDLGVTALYLNPVFQAHSSHKYDATDHRHIDIHLAWPDEVGPAPMEWTPLDGEGDDPATWQWTPADRYFIDVFLPECRRRGLRVILDGVWNHCGRRHFAFRDVVNAGVRSRYKDWFTCTFDEAGKLKTWKAWDGPNGWLPAFRQTPEGDLVEPVKAHVFAVTRRWMDPSGDGDPSDGIDGWRLDVAKDVGMRFWREWRRHVKAINPDAVLIGEIWERAPDYLKGDIFDSLMNYPFAFGVTDWLAVNPQGMTAARLGERLPRTAGLLQQNLLASHDTDRYVSMLWNPAREYDRGNSIQNGDEDYKSGKPPTEIYRLSLLGVAIQATHLGAPLIYYGDEWGMWGADDPTCRKPVPWPDAGPNADSAEVVMPEIREQYRAWLRLRQDPVVGPILRFGAVRPLDTSSDRVFAFERSLNGSRVLVVANAKPESVRVLQFGAGVDDAARAALGADDLVPAQSARWWYIPAP